MRTREFIVLFFIVDMALLNVSLLLAALFRGADLHLVWQDKLTIVLNISGALVYIIYINDMKHLKVDLWTMLRSQAQRFTAFITVATILAVGSGIENLTQVHFLGSISLFIIFKSVLSLFLFNNIALKNSVGSKIIIIGDNRIAHQIYKYCKDNSYLGYEPLGILTEKKNNRKQENIIGTMDEFQKIYDATPFVACIISLPLYQSDDIKHLIQISEKNGVRPRIVPNWYNVINRNFIVLMLGTIPLLDIRNVPLYDYPNRFWKRAFDIALSAGLLVALSPSLS